MEKDANYFRRRAAEERVAAMKAAHSAARRAHLEMAERYDDLAKTNDLPPINPDAVGAA
jgi:hypothetical protein